MSSATLATSDIFAGVQGGSQVMLTPTSPTPSTFATVSATSRGNEPATGHAGAVNVMVISVLERRTEIGVRRALGATKRHIRAQFLVESVLLSTLGGVLGVVLGIAITVGYTHVRHIVLSIPLISVGAGLGAAIVVGALAGISPAARAARLAPADAIRPA